MQDAIQVIVEEKDEKGRAFVGDTRQPLAEMTFSKAGDNLMIIDHTMVDESLRGQGVGRKLLAALLDRATERNWKILPLCPYAKSVFDKEPELAKFLR